MRSARCWLALAVVLLVLPFAAALPLHGVDPAAPLAPAPRPPAPLRAPAAADAEYEVGFSCPEAVEGPTDGAPVCPAYVLDREDVFGQPVLVLDPFNPNLAAFSAMHGGRGAHPSPADQPPTERSRDDAVHQPHTTFVTRDGGAGWEDMPYHAPDSLRQKGVGGRPTTQVYGEDNAAALDAQGRLHLAALYAHRPDAGPAGSPAPYQYSVGVWKAKRLEHPVDYNVNVRLLPAGGEGASDRIDSLHMAHVPATDLVVTAWRETPAGAAPTDAGRLVLHWTRPQDGALWTRVEADPALAACRAVSNPLALDATLYVACLADGANATEWRVLAVDSTTWKTTQAGAVPMPGTTGHLVARGAGGYMILLASGLQEDGAPTVQVAYGERGAAWSSPEEVAPDILPDDAPLLDARVTAAAWSPVSGNLHLVHLQRHDLASANAGAGAVEFRKLFVSLEAEGGVLATVDLGMGALSRVDFSPTLTGVGSGAFNDLHDSIVVWRDPKGLGGDREYVAYGDHGYVRFAEVTEENFPIPVVPLGTQVPPVPLATPGAMPVIVGLPAGLLAGAMVVRTLAARRKVAVEAGADE